METKNIKENRNFWKAEEENLLKQWADKAQCYQYMHTKSHAIYGRKNALFTIPVIIISTITGTANFAQDRFEDDVKTWVVISIGTLSIIAGIITTIYQFLKIAELNEGHRVASLSWGKFYRNLKTELMRHPVDRIPPLELIKISKDEYDRLVELSPFMPASVIKEFNSKFKKNAELIKPELCDELKPTNVFEIEMEERERYLSNKPQLTEDEINRRKQISKKIDEKTERYKNTFFGLHGRYPTKDEISKNMNKYINDDDLSDNSDVITSNEVDLSSPITPYNTSNNEESIMIDIGHVIEETNIDDYVRDGGSNNNPDDNN